MKKRTVFSLIVSVIIVLLAINYWLLFKPMQVDFDITGVGSCSIEVQLNKKYNDKFKKIRSLEKTVKLKNDGHVGFLIEKVKYPKKFRIIISSLQTHNPILIKNIQLRNGKLKLDDIDKFSINGADFSLKDNTLIIYPKKSGQEILITYNDKLKIRSALKFDFLTLVIISVLSYLFIYKLTDYAADFSTVKGKSKIEIVFLALFFLFLFIPMSYFNQDNQSKFENRSLAKWKPFINNKKEINYNFGNNFNNWFNDRFFLRNTMLKLYNMLFCESIGVYEKGVVDKDTGFMYLNVNLKEIKIEDIDKNFLALKEFNSFCKDNNIKLYVLIAPLKSLVYPLSEKTSGIIKHDCKDFYDYLKNQNELKIIYPLEELKAASKDNYMFFKTEHHWTDDAAFIGYKLLMQEIKKDFPQTSVLSEKDFNYSYNKMIRGDFNRRYNVGTTATQLGILDCDKYHNVEYRYYTHKDFDNLQVNVLDIEKHKNKDFYYPKGADFRVIQLGTSQNENLTEFFPFTFKYVKRIRNNNVKGIPTNEEFKIIKYYKKDILDFKPDIIIFVITYGNLPRLHDLVNME